MPEAHSHFVRPGDATLQLQLPAVWPDSGHSRAGESPLDSRISQLSQRLSAQSGVSQVHFEGENLCLHFDPILMPPERLERLVKDEGAQLAQRFRRETLAVEGMHCQSCAASIEHFVRRMPGVSSASVSYTAQKLQLEFDSTQISREAIASEIKKLGYQIPTPDSPKTRDDEHARHDHGAADPDAPWLVRNAELVRSLAAGLLLALGFCGEQFGGLLPNVALGFYLGAYVLGGYDLARHTIPTTLRGRFDVEFLMLLGALGAGILGQWAEGAFLLFLFSLGHALEGVALDSARNAIGALGKLTPKVARLKTRESEREVPVETLKIGDLVVVRPGDRLPVDGLIRAGASALDQSPITGESLPVEKSAGDGVFAGTINGDGALEIEVTKLAGDTTLARVLQMVEAAQSQKAPSQTFTEKFEKVFVPCVLIVAFLAATLPPLLGWMEWRVAFFRAISTVVAASPCALALATPAAVLAAIARAAQNGVLIKGGVHLENLGSLRAIAFDKTGTLTRGAPEISDVLPMPGISEAELLAVATAVEGRSSHPLAQAVMRRANELKLMIPASGDLQNLPGRGVQASVDGQLIRVGNARLMEESRIEIPDDLNRSLQIWSEGGKPTMIVARGGIIIGALALADPMRSQSQAALQSLRDIGVSTLVMLTGDNARVAAHLAPQAGVTEFRGDLLPEAKVEAIQALLKTHGKVAMVGDGVNDAPALATATVGIAMGAGGTDVALETADVALMGDDLSKLPFAVALSRQARAIIAQNLWISLGVIAVLVPSTLFGFARLGVAVAFHEGSTLVVVLNALRLLRFQMRG